MLSYDKFYWVIKLRLEGNFPRLTIFRPGSEGSNNDPNTTITIIVMQSTNLIEYS